VSKRLLPHAPRIRVAVRTPEEHAQFCEALTQVAATL
jgi:histidinol-phosphate/aromatic aminotransferase/cobyric acid decarboxylase-like protein